MQANPDLVKSDLKDVGEGVIGEASVSDNKATKNFEFSGDTNISALYWILSIIKAHPENYLMQLNKVGCNIDISDDVLNNKVATLFYWKEVLDKQDNKMLSMFRHILSVGMTGFVGFAAILAFINMGLSFLLEESSPFFTFLSFTTISFLFAFAGFLFIFFRNFSKSTKLMSALKKIVDEVSEKERKDNRFKNFEFNFPAFSGGDFSFLRKNNTYINVIRDSNSKYNYVDLSMYLAFNISPFVPLCYQREEIKDVTTWAYKIYQELFVEYFNKGYLTKDGTVLGENIPESMYWRVKGVARLHELFQESYSFSYMSMFAGAKKYKKLVTTIFSVMEVVLVDNLSEGGALSGSLADVLEELKAHNAKYLSESVSIDLNGSKSADGTTSGYKETLPIMKNDHLLKESNLNKRRERILQAWAESGDKAIPCKLEEEQNAE